MTSATAAPAGRRPGAVELPLAARLVQGWTTVCTEHDENAVVVCDVAIADVRRALLPLMNVEIAHVPMQGTRVVNHDPAQVREFGARIGAAIAAHGGSLQPSH